MQELVAFSRVALKAITAKGAKEPNKDEMYELLEFMAGICRDDPVGENVTVGQLCEFVGGKNEDFGHRCEKMLLRPD